jgi:hypothetical protein
MQADLIIQPFLRPALLKTGLPKSQPKSDLKLRIHPDSSLFA